MRFLTFSEPIEKGVKSAFRLIDAIPMDKFYALEDVPRTGFEWCEAKVLDAAPSTNCPQSISPSTFEFYHLGGQSCI